MPKEPKLNPYILFAIGALVLPAGMLMRSFPVLVFCGLAPVFAIADHAKGEHFLNKLELAGGILVMALFAAQFQTASLATIITQAIVMTTVFAAFTYTNQSLGPALGKLPLILFWLALEYIFLKMELGSVFFLGDALQLKTTWLGWTRYTGYLGSTLWILVGNLFLYMALLQKGIRIPFLVTFFIVIAGPIIYSYTLHQQGVPRGEMIALYGGRDTPPSADYSIQGEWIPRTAAWVSALILLYAMVKNNIRKK